MIRRQYLHVTRPLQDVHRHPPPLLHPGVFSLAIRTTERGVHMQASAPHSPTRVGSLISSNSWLAVPGSFRACSDGELSSGADTWYTRAVIGDSLCSF
jgi:hypothetical protein